jgi:serine protease Do
MPRQLVLHVASSFLLVLVLAVAPAALAEGTPDPGWLGVSVVDAPDRARDDAATPPLRSVIPGALVAGVVRDSPADRAGLRASDVVLRIDGREVGSASELVRLVQGREAAAWIEVAIERGGDERTLQVKLDSRPERSSRMPIKRGWVGLVPITVPQQLREFWGGSEESGVLVGEIDEASPAAIAGLRPGDLILRFGEREFADAGALRTAIRRGGVGNALEVEVSRQGAVFRVDLEIEDEPEEQPEIE